jgi:hypothetical protein
MTAVSLDTCVSFVRGELRSVDCELLSGEARGGYLGGQIHEEELKQPEVAQLGARTGRPLEPGSQLIEARGRDREGAPAASVRLTSLGYTDLKSKFERIPLEIFNQGRLQLIDELFAPEYVERTPQPGVAPTREGFKQWATALRAAFPDIHYTIDTRSRRATSSSAGSP